MAKLTDKQHKRIIAMYAESQNYSLVAREFGISVSTVRRHCNGDSETAEKVKQKKEENTASVLAFMDSKKKDVCLLLDRLLAAMNDPTKIGSTPLIQLATTMGIVIDKYTANECLKRSGDSAANNLFEAIDTCGEEDDFSDIPEIQQTAESDAAMVENESPSE